MTHLDDGTLRAWLDGELTRAETEDIEARLAGDFEARRTVEQLREQGERTRELLEALDVEAPTERVRAALGSVTRSPASSPPSADVRALRTAASLRVGAWSRWARWSRPAQAAALVLILAGAATAAMVPGSPVRDWLSRAFGTSDEPTVVPAAVPSPEGPDEAALYVRPTGGRLRVELVGVPVGAEIRVELVARDSAAMHAPEGSDFDWDQERGLARAVVRGGPIRLELPAALAEIDLTVDNRVYMVRRGGLTDLRVDPTYESGPEIHFRAGS